MTISYTGAKLMQGVSGDTKPSTVPNGIIFNETDTGKTYWHSGSGGFPTFIDNFKTYTTQGSADAVWISANTVKSRVNITTYLIDFDFEDNLTSDSHIYYDLGSTISDTAWVLRFKFKLTTCDINSRTWFGIASDTTSQATAKDFIGMLIHDVTGSSPKFKTADTDGAVLPTAGDSDSTNVFSMNTDYWVEIKRTSATAYSVSFYTDSIYTNLVETISGTCVSTTASLRYISFYNRNDFDSTNNQIGTIDDIKFKNGVTTW